MADTRRRLDALESDAFERELERRIEMEIEAQLDALEAGLTPQEFRKVVEILSDLDRGQAS